MISYDVILLKGSISSNHFGAVSEHPSSGGRFPVSSRAVNCIWQSNQVSRGRELIRGEFSSEVTDNQQDDKAYDD